MSPCPENLNEFVENNLRAGAEPSAIKQRLLKWGLNSERIRDLMGEAYAGRRPSSAVDYKALSKPLLVRCAEREGGPMRVPVSKAQLYVWKNFLNADLCSALMELTDRSLRESTTADTFGDRAVRTSRTADIGQYGGRLVHELDDAITAALGIHWSYAEATQAQRYDTGQEFKSHHDYFEPGTREHKAFCEFMGQRTWTFMVYLNDVEEGGATRFRRLDRIFRPESGKALVWNNLTPEGIINPYTIHQGMKVRSGRKYVITKWFRERGWGEMLFE